MQYRQQKLRRAALDVIKYARHLVDCEKSLKNNLFKDMVRIKVFLLLKKAVISLDKKEEYEEKIINRRTSKRN